MAWLTKIVYNTFVLASRTVFRKVNSGSISFYSTRYWIWLSNIVYLRAFLFCWSNCANFRFDRVSWTDYNVNRIRYNFNTCTSYTLVSSSAGNLWASLKWNTHSIDAMIALSACEPAWSSQTFSNCV